MANLFTLTAPRGAVTVEVSFRCDCPSGTSLYLHPGDEKRCIGCDRVYRLDEAKGAKK